MKPKRAEKRMFAAPDAAATTAPESTRTSAATRSARPRTTSDPAARWSAKGPIVEAIATSGRFETLGRAIHDTGLSEMLAGIGPFTVFAPTDSAFAEMPSAELHALLQDAAALKRLLAFHIVPNRVRAPLVGHPASAVTIDGRSLTLTHENGEYRVENARIVKTNIPASNGVIHAINAVLTPR